MASMVLWYTNMEFRITLKYRTNSRFSGYHIKTNFKSPMIHVKSCYGLKLLTVNDVTKNPY